MKDETARRDIYERILNFLGEILARFPPDNEEDCNLKEIH